MDFFSEMEDDEVVGGAPNDGAVGGTGLFVGFLDPPPMTWSNEATWGRRIKRRRRVTTRSTLGGDVLNREFCRVLLESYEFFSKYGKSPRTT